MIIIPLLLTMGLDMSLPEFQPTTDLSGNYIVGSYDVSSDEPIVEELTENPIEYENSSVADSLSVAPVRIETLSVSGNDDVVSAIEQFNADNSAYWDEFLDSYLANFYTKYNSSHFRGSGTNHFYFNSSGKIASMNSSTQVFMYVPVKKGRTYTIRGVPTLPETHYFNSGFVSTLTPEIGSDVVGFQRHYSGYDPNGTTFTSPINGYFGFYSNTNYDFNSMKFYVLETQTYRDDVTVIKEEFDIKLRALIFITLMNFIYPIAMSIKSNIVGGDK